MGEVARRDMPSQDAPTIADIDRLSNDQIRYIASTEVVPKHLRNRPEAMLAVILKGRSLGLDDMQALDSIDFIDGKAALSGEAMVALVRSKGHSIMWELVPGEKCTARGRRGDTGDEGEITWTVAMAKEAGLWGRGAWKGYPDTMLTWRAVSQLCRFLYADVLRGVSYTPEEAQEVAERGAVTQAVADLPALEEQTVRTETVSMPTEAQLNRIAHLEQRSGDAYRMVLRGVFGVEMASELNTHAAGQYEAMLEQALPPEDSAEGPNGTDSATDGVAGAVDETGSNASEVSSPSAGTNSDAETDNQPALNGSASEALLDEPAPDELVEGEVVDDEHDRLVDLAGDTLIPIGSYKGTALKDIHDGWIKYGLENSGRLPAPFVEALELYARERREEIWKQVRG